MIFEGERNVDYLKLDSIKGAWERVREKEKRRIKETDFVGTYESADIEADLERVSEKKSGILESITPEDREQIIFGKILETILEEQIELNDWLGEGVSTVRASEFDDYFNGVDTVAEINDADGRKHLALAIDATHGSTYIGDKFIHIKQEIDEGVLTTVKYYQDSEGNKKQGGLKMCPRVVIGLDKEQIAELAVLWVDDKKKELASHPIQIILLEEVEKQLQAFAAYASAKGKTEIAQIYEMDLMRVRGVLEAKRKTIGKVVNLQDWKNGKGRVYDSILLQAERFEVEHGNEAGADERFARLDRHQRDAISRMRRLM